MVDTYGVELFVTKGFSSVSYLQEAAEFINQDGRPTFVYLLTNLDPSGLNIATAIGTELVRRTADAEGWSPVRVRRIAVTPEQVAEWELPTRPTKADDPKSRKFMARYGTASVELDAIPPDTLRDLVRDCIEEHMDTDRLETMKEQEERERDGLEQIEDLMAGAADDS